MPKLLDADLIGSLQRLASAQPEFDEFFRALATRTRNASVTELDRFLESPELAPLNNPRGRAAAVQFFRRLAQIDIGEFRVGRRGKATRFTWKMPLTEIASAAVGEQEAAKPATSEKDEGNRAGSERVMHTYVLRLRENMTVRLELPVDLTEGEAKRIGTFVEALPLRPL